MDSLAHVAPLSHPNTLIVLLYYKRVCVCVCFFTGTVEIHERDSEQEARLADYGAGSRGGGTARGVSVSVFLSRLQGTVE